MPLNDLILSKRGPLAKVWLSAHHERKLSKQQALGVDVGETVEAILTQDEGPTTLRISGQLMLGVTRIYSRKVQYLLDDCKDTRERITLAFRPGIVDLPEDQITASKNAITFSDVRNDFDFLDWTWAAPPETISRGLHTAPPAQITLRGSNREFGAFNFGRPAARSFDLSSRQGSASSRHGSHDDSSSSHLDSQDFSGIDLGLDLGLDFDLGGYGDESVEVGRHVMGAASREGSVGSRFGRKEGSLGLTGGAENFGEVDLNLDFDNFDGAVPDLHDDRARRETSALSTPPPMSPPADVSMTEITPRTAARVANLADKNDKATDMATQRGPGVRPKKLRLLTADDELELADEDFAPPNEDDTDILGPERFIPSNPDIVRLREIVADPASHFIPTIKVGGTTMFYAGPEGLAPELQELFNFPATVLRRVRDGADEDAEEHRQAKRARLEEDHPQGDDVELGRRGSVMRSEHPFDFGAGAGADDSFNVGGDFDFGGMAENDFGMPEELVTPRKRRERERERNQREASLAPSRAESIARQIQFGERDEDHPLAMFDGRLPRPDAPAQDSLGSLATPSKSSITEEETVRATKGGYSKNTGMAMGMLRRELEAIEAESETDAGEKKVKFGQLADKASRKAASTFFFELLVLGTRDCVKLEQKKAFGEIEIRGKDKLWEDISA